MTRPPAVAGSFYPAEPTRLARLVDAWLSIPVAGSPAAIAPHAGHQFCGGLAGQSVSALAARGGPVRRLVLIGPSHYARFTGLVCPSADRFATPLGELPVDSAALDLLTGSGACTVDDTAHRREHALEVLLPFVQRALGAIPLVPLLTGAVAPQQISSVLDDLCAGEGAVVLVSSDLSHFLQQSAAIHRDQDTARAIEAGKAIDVTQACGAMVINGLQHYLKSSGAALRTLGLATSADSGGEVTEVVGYGAFAAYPVGQAAG